MTWAFVWARGRIARVTKFLGFDSAPVQGSRTNLKDLWAASIFSVTTFSFVFGKGMKICVQVLGIGTGKLPTAILGGNVLKKRKGHIKTFPDRLVARKPDYFIPRIYFSHLTKSISSSLSEKLLREK